MHTLSTTFVLAYHGCDEAVAANLLNGAKFKPSQNDYDWLGPGIYFWEANPQRGLDFAIESAARKNSRIVKPAVVGAIVNMGRCLDLTTLAGIKMMRSAYKSLKTTMGTAGEPLPENSQDLLRRKLDCAVIRRLHSILDEDGDAVDTVKGVFTEGKPIFPGAGVLEKTHIQIAVCDVEQIKGVFRVPPDQLKHWTPKSAVHAKKGNQRRAKKANRSKLRMTKA